MSVLDGIATALLVILAIWSASATINALRPFRNLVLLLPSMLWSWFVISLPEQHLVLQIAITGVLIWLGALSTPIGWIALVILITSWIGTMLVLIRARRSGSVVAAELERWGIPQTGHRVPGWRTIVAVPFRGRSVAKTSNVVYRRVAGRVLKLDVYTSTDDESDGRPVFLYIHGGAWVVGDKREQGLPIIHHLARSGWVCFSVNYRLSPGAGWPDHLEDIKHAIAWVKGHAAEHGGDADFLVVAGGSAGGHLAAMAGLTANRPEYQSGFETADTSVQVTVPIYGIYDTTNRLGVQSKQFVPMLMEPLVIKAFLSDEPEKFHDASPLDRVVREAPPFVIAQGDNDTMAPVEEARLFVDELRAGTDGPVVYFEFPGAQHIFDLGWSYQSARMIEGVQSVLESLHADHQERDPGSESGSERHPGRG